MVLVLAVSWFSHSMPYNRNTPQSQVDYQRHQEQQNDHQLNDLGNKVGALRDVS